MMSNISRFILLTFLILLTGGKSYSQEFSPDHYLSYDIKTTPFDSETVNLQDRFLDGDFRVVRPLKLLNPTLKRHNGQVHEIDNEDLHYTAYALRSRSDETINQEVHVANQFGDFVVNTMRPDRLLVPTKKIDFSLFGAQDDVEQRHYPVADHYLCYEIPFQTITTENGFLRDQFRRREFDTLTARHVCTPVRKTHDDEVSDIINDNDSNNLMCFDLDSERTYRLVLLLNQFGIKTGLVTRDDQLCVPSTIRIDEPPPPACEGSAPDEELQCNGTCPNADDLCLPDITTQLCRCVPPAPPACGDVDPENGVCNGICEDPASECLPNADGTDCECSSPTIFCTDGTPDPDTGLCGEGAVCPNGGDVCQAVGGECVCVPEEPAACGDVDPDNGVCDGACDDPEARCEPTEDGLGCECNVPTVFCTDGTPDPDTGLCAEGAACPNPGETCQADGDLCVCVPPEPAACGDVDPENGVCNGACEDPAASCLPSADGLDCECTIPTVLCTDGTPDPDTGLCAEGAVCPNPGETCQADGDLCVCVPPAPAACADVDPENGVCNGACEDPAASCLPTADGLDCECTIPTVLCTDGTPDPDTGLCGGTCPNALDLCQAQGDICACVPPTPPACADIDPVGGVCGGVCADPLANCLTTPDGLDCECVIPTQLCTDGTPDPDTGVCGGICADPTDTCTAQGDLCACVPPPPPACADIDPVNGVCGGSCPDINAICQPTADGTDCECITPPPLCTDGTPDPDTGLCGGVCPNVGDTCEAQDDLCICVPPAAPACVDVDPENGVCNGDCEDPDADCLPTADGADCECVVPTPITCGDVPPEEGECAGICAPGEACTVNATGDACTCVPTTATCAPDGEGGCTGACTGVNELCALIEGTTDCGCILQ